MNPSEKTNSVGGATSPFPTTRWTLVAALGQSEPAKSEAALRELCAIYRQPIVTWLTMRGYGQDAEDLANSFIAYLLEQNRFKNFVRKEAKFRSFLLQCLKGFLRDEWQKTVAVGRGGGAEHVDIAQLDVAESPEPDKAFDAKFAHQLHQRVLARLEKKHCAAGRAERFHELQRFLLGQDSDVSYQEIAKRLGMKPNAVKKAVHDLRDAYYEGFREEVLETVSPDKLDEEMRYLLPLLLIQTDATNPI